MATKVKSAQRLTAARKLELYLATRSPEAPVGEILRQYGLHLDDLRQTPAYTAGAGRADH